MNEATTILTSDQTIDRLKEIFISDSGTYFLQLEDGRYKCIREKPTDAIIEQHLNKELTLGILPKANSTTKWICFDVDSKDFMMVSSIVGTLRHHDLRAEIEDSGGKGYHVWVFMNGHVENAVARKFARFIIDESDLSDEQKKYIEVFPKQDVITDVGSPIKLPWGIHRRTGNKTCFVDNNITPLGFDGWYQGIEKADPEALKDILEMNGITIDVIESPPARFKTPNEIKPCVMQYIEDGVAEGDRNKVAFIIATEYRRTGKSKEETVANLINWNKKNKTIHTSYTEQEIFNTVNAAFGGYHKHTYGCKNTNLKRHCVGQEMCLYLYKAKKLNPSKGGGFNKMMFYKLGWQKELNGSQNHMYSSVLPLLEEEKNIPPGGWVFTSYDQLAHYLGKVESNVNKVLVKLENKGLIEWEHGRRGKDHSPTKIRRVVPIPKPPQ